MVKKINKANDTFTASQVGSLVEELRGDFRSVGEDVKSLRTKVDAMNEELGHQKEDILIIKTDVRIIKTEIGSIKNIFTDHQRRISQVETAK